MAGRLYRASYRHMAHFTLLLILFAAAAYKSEVRWMGVRSVCKLKRCVTTLPALAVACVNLCTATADLEGQLQQLTAFVAAPPFQRSTTPAPIDPAPPLAHAPLLSFRSTPPSWR